MRSFAARSSEPELMDGADVTEAEFAACLADLAAVNTLTLARGPTLYWLERATQGWPEGARFTVLDVGFGDGDMLRAVHAWAERRGLRPQLTGIDLNPSSAPAARARTDPAVVIDYRTGDLFTAAEPADFVISSLVAHHMEHAELVRFLGWLEANAAKGWFVNDLHRRALPYYGFKLLAWALRRHPFVRHDGPVSIARSFRPEDWARLLREAGVPPGAAEVRRRFPWRLCVGKLK